MTETSDQTETIAFLSDPATHDLPPGESVMLHETHGAFVFLAGDSAFKLKKAVRRAYFDYATPDLRAEMRARELEINRRIAPNLYRDVAPIRRSADGRLAIGGESGEIIDHVLRMRRFDEADQADRMLEAGRFGVDEARAIATAVAGMHSAAERTPQEGGAEGMDFVIRGNLEAVSENAEIFDAGDVVALNERLLPLFYSLSGLLENRRLSGWTRRCHGDLHLGNVARIEGRLTPFDAIEFDDQIACCDVLYDLTFLLMDLHRRGRADLAGVVLNAYLERCEGLESQILGLRATPLFLAVRATIRAHIAATRARETRDPAQREAKALEAERAMDLAIDYLAPRGRPPLICLGGYQGSGKSTLAFGLAARVGPPPGAIVLRSDAVRKRLFNVALEEALPDAAYSAAASAQVFQTIAHLARTALSAGYAVIADAVNVDPERRAELAASAAAAGAPCLGLWLDAPREVLLSRVRARSRAAARDASDADDEVLEITLRHPVGDLGDWASIDAAGDAQATLDNAMAVLQARGLAGEEGAAPPKPARDPFGAFDDD